MKHWSCRSIMHQSIPPALSTPAPATAGHLPVLSVPGLGHLQILHRPVAEHLPTVGPFSSFWQARGFLSDQNITTQPFTGKNADLLICQGQEKIEEGCKGMFSILCTHFSIAYQNYIAKLELSMWINVFWLLNQISVDIIWRTSFHIYKAIHNV